MIGLKSPRTPHLSGSGFAGHENDIDRLKWDSVLGKNVVLEEKVDGSEVSFHFDENANLILRERANNLDMGKRGGSEKVYDELKNWLNNHQDGFFDQLQDRFMVGLFHNSFPNCAPLANGFPAGSESPIGWLVRGSQSEQPLHAWG